MPSVEAANIAVIANLVEALVSHDRQPAFLIGVVACGYRVGGHWRSFHERLVIGPAAGRNDAGPIAVADQPVVSNQ